MALTPAEKQKQYRERRKAKAGNGNAVTSQPETGGNAVTVTREAETSKAVISEVKPLEVISGAGRRGSAKRQASGAAAPAWQDSPKSGGVAVADRVEVESVRISDSKARSLANLKPWPSGVSGNPAGRPTIGASVKEWWNQLQFKSEVDWEAIYADKSQPGNKRQAVRMLLDGFDADGQVRHRAMEMIISHTDGKATQRVESNVTIDIHATSIVARLRADLGIAAPPLIDADAP